MSKTGDNVTKIPYKINKLNPATYLKPDEKLMCGNFDISWMYVIFSDIEGYEGYKADSDGKIWSRWTYESGRVAGGARGGRRRILTDQWSLVDQVIGRRGYSVVRLRSSVDFKRAHISVHKIIITSLFSYPYSNDRGECQCRHLNGNEFDNRMINLMWGTAQENADDREKHGKTYHGSRHWNSEFSEQDVLDIVDLSKQGFTCAEICAKYNVYHSTIARILSGKTWARLTRIKN